MRVVAQEGYENALATMSRRIAQLEATSRQLEQQRAREREDYQRQLQTVADEAMRLKREATERDIEREKYIAGLESRLEKGKGRAEMQTESDRDDEKEDDEEDGLFNWSTDDGGKTDDDAMEQDSEDRQVCYNFPQSTFKRYITETSCRAQFLPMAWTHRWPIAKIKVVRRQREIAHLFRFAGGSILVDMGPVTLP